MVKIDAALFPKTNRMGLGIVIRNHREEFIAACRQCIDKITSPELAEAIAFKRVILFAFGLPYKQVIIATDCLSLIKKLRSVAIDLYVNYHSRYRESRKCLYRCSLLFM